MIKEKRIKAGYVGYRRDARQIKILKKNSLKMRCMDIIIMIEITNRVVLLAPP